MSSTFQPEQDLSTRTSAEMHILGPAIRQVIEPAVWSEARDYRRAATLNDSAAILSQTIISRAIQAAEDAVESELAYRIYAKCWRNVHALCDDYMERQDRADIHEAIKVEFRASDQLRREVRAELLSDEDFRRRIRKNAYCEDIQDELRREFKTAVVNQYYEWHAESIRHDLKDADHAKEYVEEVLPRLFQEGRVSLDWCRENMSSSWLCRHARTTAPSPPEYYRDIGTYTGSDFIPRPSVTLSRSPGPSRRQKRLRGSNDDVDDGSDGERYRRTKSPRFTYDDAGLSNFSQKVKTQSGLPLLYDASSDGYPMTKSHPLADREHHPDHLRGLGQLRGDGILGYPLKKPKMMDSDWKRRERLEQRGPSESPRFNVERSSLMSPVRRHDSPPPFSTRTNPPCPIDGLSKVNGSRVGKTHFRGGRMYRPAQSQTLPSSPTDRELKMPPGKPLLIWQCKKWQARERQCQEEMPRADERDELEHASDSSSTLEHKNGDDEAIDEVQDDIVAYDESTHGKTSEQEEMENEEDEEDDEDGEDDEKIRYAVGQGDRDEDQGDNMGAGTESTTGLQYS